MFAAIILIYSDFQSYKVHPSPLIACGEGVGGGVLVPGLMTICCNREFLSNWHDYNPMIFTTIAKSVFF